MQNTSTGIAGKIAVERPRESEQRRADPVLKHERHRAERRRDRQQIEHDRLERHEHRPKAQREHENGRDRRSSITTCIKRPGNGALVIVR